MKPQPRAAIVQTGDFRSGERSNAKIWAEMRWQTMLVNDGTVQQSVRSHRRALDSASLQFRLTLGVTACSILGLSGLAAWAGWKMQQMLVTTHSDNVKRSAERFLYDVARYRQRHSIEASVQQAIDQLFPQTQLLWATDSEGQVFAQSRALQTAPPGFAEQLYATSAMPPEPRVYRVEGRYLVMCSSPLQLEGRSIGQLYLAQDITADQVMLLNAIQGLSLVSMLSVMLMATAIALYIRRALRPLRGMSQMAGTISANELSQAKLSLMDSPPTEVRELAETLNAMLSRLARSWEQQKQLIGDISHELRTPLSVAYGSLQALQRRSATLTETQQELLETALGETDRTIQLLQTLLELARADNGCMYLHPERLRLNDLVSEVVNMVQRLQDRQVHVKAEEEIWMTTDRNCLSQILTNLLENAISYSPCDQPIVISLSQSQHQTILQVRDYGCGISPEQQLRIFDRFYRVDDARSRATGGTGLGLAIVKMLVENMNGEITVWSEPEQGSMFTVMLPSHLEG